jgi:hypothetical protein
LIAAKVFSASEISALKSNIDVKKNVPDRNLFVDRINYPNWHNPQGRKVRRHFLIPKQKNDRLGEQRRTS